MMLAGENEQIRNQTVTGRTCAILAGGFVATALTGQSWQTLWIRHPVQKFQPENTPSFRIQVERDLIQVRVGYEMPRAAPWGT
jgi:hypothetical protein